MKIKPILLLLLLTGVSQAQGACPGTVFLEHPQIGPLICLNSDDCIDSICYLHYPEPLVCKKESGEFSCLAPENMIREGHRTVEERM